MNTLRGRWHPGLRAAAVAAAGLWLLSGCGSEPKPASTVAAPNTPAPATAPADPTVRMARAVGDGKPGAAVGIKYDLTAKPQVGVPLEVKVVFLPTAGVDSLTATFAGMEGITLAGVLNASFRGVKSGAVYEHQITVTPERVGVFYVTVNASTQFGGSAMGRTFAIPFMVGDQSAQSKPATPQKDANGKPIQPMKAVEKG